ncbi:uncharacterized protein LOC143622513 [Bidens hawaiensis]|uniref:uncharacterized protein LOC143622513 n=1 Tax=Bidens hawaiensis TaxID=980011 RepID=UPI00404A0E48
MATTSYSVYGYYFLCCNSRSFERLTSDLYRVTHDKDEPHRYFVSKLSKEALEIPNLDVSTAVQAFKMCLKKDTSFYEDLVMNLDEARNRALRVNVVDDNGDDESYPNLNDYCFADDILGLMCAMQDQGENARWPQKNEKNGAWKDKSKWCAFHEDFRRMTEDCLALRREISYLLRKGQLKEFMGKKNRSRDTEQDPKRAESPPAGTRIVNVISGGSDICGTSYSAAKRNAKIYKVKKPEGPMKTLTLPKGVDVLFDDEDRNNIQDLHHDGLVITLYIANCFVHRILVVNESSVNIIQLDTLKRMNIPESKIVSKSSILVGFTGEAKSTVGEIKLLVYVERVNSMHKFYVIDARTSFNVILGRPWIHDMKTVPSTHHECIKMATPWGIAKIQGDQQESKDCYASSMKSTAKPTQA